MKVRGVYRQLYQKARGGGWSWGWGGRVFKKINSFSWIYFSKKHFINMSESATGMSES